MKPSVRVCAILPLALCLAAMPLLAGNKDDFRPPTPEELQLKSTPLAPGASAVALDWAQREDDTMNWASQYVRIKVLTEDGRKYADIEIPYVRWKVDVSDIRARTIQPDGTIAWFNGKIFDKTVLRHGDLRWMAKTFTLPDVHAGTIIEYSWMHRWKEPDFSGVRWRVQRSIPVLHESLWFRPYTGGVAATYTIFSMSRGLPSGKHMAKVSCCYELELQDLPPFDSEPFGPPEETLSARVYLLYSRQVRSTKEYWDEMGRDMLHDVEDFLGRPSSVADEVTKATKDAATADAKLRSLYARARQIRNLSFEVEKTETEAKRDKTRDNKSSIDVVRNGYGYRYEINRAFVTMARQAGFDAHIVNVSDREEDFFNNNVPDAWMIGTEIAEVVVDGKPRYFDPGTPYVPYGMLPWQNANNSGFRMSGKSGEWVPVPGSEAPESTIERTADLRFEGDQIRGKVVAKYAGLEAQHRRFRNRNDDDAASRKSFEDEAKKWFPEGSSVKLTNVSALRSSDEPLVVDYDVELPTLGAATGSRVIVPMAVFQSNEKNEMSSEKRSTAVYFAYSYQRDDRVTLHVPAGWRVEGLPARSTLDLKALAFDLQYDAAADKVDMSRKVTVQSNILEPKFYPTVRDFFTKLAAADRDSVILRKPQ